VFDYASAKMSDGKRFMALHRRLLERGVFVPPSQFEACFLSSAHTDADLKLTVDAYRRAFEAW
jgi:glutamate-1-semialdehyde 2,1-aminomutase